jgi:hypothetical protein
MPLYIGSSGFAPGAGFHERGERRPTPAVIAESVHTLMLLGTSNVIEPVVRMREYAIVSTRLIQGAPSPN